MGGRITTAVSSLYPERIKKTVIVEYTVDRNEVGIAKIKAIVSRTWDSLDAAVEETMQFNTRRTRENILSRLQYTLKEREDGRWTWKLDPTIVESIFGDTAKPGAALSDNIANLLRNLKVPTMIVLGAQTNVAKPESAEEMKELIPVQCDIVTIPNAGHSVPGDNPVAFYQCINDFVNN